MNSNTKFKLFLSKNYCDYQIASSNDDLLNGSMYSYLNPLNYNLYQEFTTLKKIRYRVDGFYMCFLLNKFVPLGVPRAPQSFDFTGVADLVFKEVSNKEKRIFIAGGNKSEIKAFCKIISLNYPKLNICGYLDGYHENQDIVSEITKINPDVVLLGLGSLKQERVGYDLINDSQDMTVFTCGAFISQTSGSSFSKHYYPVFYRSYGFRFIYRFYKEPRTIYRVLKFYPILFFKMLNNALRS
jgi:UDP-Gal:alpha-D-GlcNAc-diphosphoundecaprenol beta-1,4-galactosyltransferase